VDLDSPAVDADSLDDESQEALAAFEVEFVERCDDPLAEVGEPAAQPVLGGQLGAACGERLFLLQELAAAGCERGGASGELCEFDQAGLVGVEQPGALSLLGVDGRVQAFELGGDQFVLVGLPGEKRALGGEQLLGIE
jgi:hypothetical protein